MKKIIYMALIATLLCSFYSCASSNSITTASNGVDLSKYKYVVFGTEDDGDAELADMLLLIQNEISERFEVVSSAKAHSALANGEYVLSPRISAKSEKWDGGHTYLTISFYDYETNQMIAVVKSSGIGLSISHDQRIAMKAIKKELDKSFPKR